MIPTIFPELTFNLLIFRLSPRRALAKRLSERNYKHSPQEQLKPMAKVKQRKMDFSTVQATTYD